MKCLLLAFLFCFPSHSAGLPPLPGTVWSMFGPVEVARQHPTDCGLERAIGCYHRLQRRIVVDDSLDSITAWRVLEHERFHVAAFDQNAGFSSLQDEQVAANVYANYRVAEMLSVKP